MQLKFSVAAASLLFFTTAFATPYGGNLAERSTNPIAMKRWAEANREGVTYDSLSNLPMNFRQALYNELPKEQKTDLWVTHAEHYLASNPDLTPEQQEAVQKAIELFKTPVEERTSESDKAFEEECRSVLGWDQAARLLTTLGPAEDASKVQQTSAKLMKRAPQCDCSSGDDWCGAFSTCIAGRDQCLWQAKKCGLGWDWDCDGRCD